MPSLLEVKGSLGEHQIPQLNEKKNARSDTNTERWPLGVVVWVLGVSESTTTNCVS